MRFGLQLDKVAAFHRANHFAIDDDLYYKSLEMHTGAVIEGKLVYLGDGVADEVL